MDEIQSIIENDDFDEHDKLREVVNVVRANDLSEDDVYEFVMDHGDEALGELFETHFWSVMDGID